MRRALEKLRKSFGKASEKLFKLWKSFGKACRIIFVRKIFRIFRKIIRKIIQVCKFSIKTIVAV